MNARIAHKRIAQWQKPYHDSIAHYSSKIRHCQRWRNRRKAQKMWKQSINRYFKRAIIGINTR